jgi:D-alanyl-D-alanine carboxypeptidase
VTRRQQCLTWVAVFVAGLTLGGTPRPAEAVIPDVARTWATLMYRSLTARATIAQLRTTRTTQQAAVTGRAAAVTAAKAANQSAQTRLTAATTADQDARTRYTAAARALTDAKKALAKASKQRPRSKAATTRAQQAVTAATSTVNTRKTQAGTASGVLKEARANAQTATTGLNDAVSAWTAASTAVRQTEQKITGVGTPAGLAGRAAAVSRDVVSQVRAGFTIADTTSVYGVTVHRSLGYPFRRMLDDAKADGIALSGGGFRTRERQIELRKINGCPDVYTAPASSCRVPTAIPGRSLHEIGLAVDITSGGKTITAKSPAFRWLVAHAGAYGFVNLPAEAWHWSITGN